MKKEDKNKIIILRSFHDWIVSKSTTPISECKNIVMPIIGHGVGIAFAMIFYQRTIVEFIKK